jgi:hypothetical protein
MEPSRKSEAVEQPNQAQVAAFRAVQVAPGRQAAGHHLHVGEDNENAKV